MTKTQSVMVTGIGSNVGQGALRILRSLSLPLRLIGTNTSLPCGGNHLCDAVYETPFATSPNYISSVRTICEDEDVVLILPCTDYEAYELAAATGLPQVVTSAPETQRAFLDKFETWTRCSGAGIPFARSSLPSAYRGGFSTVVVKPREGRGSREIHVDPPDPASFDDTFVVQERAVGREITVGLYVTRRGNPHGFVALDRELSAGTTVLCSVTREHDAVLAPIVARFAGEFDVRGPCNIQAIATPTGEIVPFEVNGRISGTASIRHRLGFRDVEYAVREYLLEETLPPVEITDGVGIRLLMDVIYPGRDIGEGLSSATPHELF